MPNPVVGAIFAGRCNNSLVCQLQSSLTPTPGGKPLLRGLTARSIHSFHCVCMRYLFILLTVAGLTGFGNGQVQAQDGAATLHRAVQWSGMVELADPRTGARHKEPTFSGAFVPRGGQAQMLAIRIEGAVSQGEIQNPIYEPFTAVETKFLATQPLPAAPVTRLLTGTERKLPVTTLLVQPTRRNPGSGQAERLVWRIRVQQNGVLGLGRL